MAALPKHYRFGDSPRRAAARSVERCLRSFLYIRQRRRKRITMFATRLGDFSRHVLSDLGDFDQASPFDDESWYIGARGHETTFFKRFNMQSNGCFAHRPILTREGVETTVTIA
jgi:hypothetical protein